MKWKLALSFIISLTAFAYSQKIDEETAIKKLLEKESLMARVSSELTPSTFTLPSMLEKSCLLIFATFFFSLGLKNKQYRET